MTRLIDADDFFRTFSELAIEPYINAPTIEKIPHGKCKKCKAYRQYGSRADGLCDIARMTPEGETYINVNEDFFCSYFREATDNDKV